MAEIKFEEHRENARLFFSLDEKRVNLFLRNSFFGYLVFARLVFLSLIF